MSWLRSRRFYAGLAIGLVPLLFLAFQSPRGGSEDDGQRVVVRTYSACIPDSLAAERTADLVQRLPKNAVLVENFNNNCCCCCGGEATHQHARPQGMTSFRAPARAPGAVDLELVDQPAPSNELAALTPRDVDYPFMQSSPGGLPAGPAARRGFNALWGLLAAPLIFIVGAFDNDKPLPPGIICPDDSGLPTGPERPQC